MQQHDFPNAGIAANRCTRSRIGRRPANRNGYTKTSFPLNGTQVFAPSKKSFREKKKATFHIKIHFRELQGGSWNSNATDNGRRNKTLPLKRF